MKRSHEHLSQDANKYKHSHNIKIGSDTIQLASPKNKWTKSDTLSQVKLPGLNDIQVELLKASSELVNSLHRPTPDKSKITGICKINGRECEFLTDTGATRTVLDFGCLTKQEQNQIIPSETAMMAANGTPIEVMGKLSMKIQLGNTVSFTEILIASGIGHQCYLGMDILFECPMTKTILLQLAKIIETSTDELFKTQDNQLEEFKAAKQTNEMASFNFIGAQPRIYSLQNDEMNINKFQEVKINLENKITEELESS